MVAVAAPSPQGHGVVPAEEAPVILLGEGAAVEGPGVVAKPVKATRTKFRSKTPAEVKIRFCCRIG